MKKTPVLRVIMLIAGIAAVCAILLSPSFSQVKQEKKSAGKETVLIQAPSDAIPGSAVKMQEPEVPLITEIQKTENKEFFPTVNARVVTKYFKVLLRTLIAPNAP